jgi:hypothetical protein
MSSSVLSQKLFHGTHAELHPGEVIEPRDHEHAYAAGNYSTADNFGSFNRVYKVAPVDPVEKRTETVNWRKNNPYHASQKDIHVSKKGFKVVGEVTKKREGKK